jgi:hypothetical protein
MVSGHGSIEHKKANKILNRIKSEASFFTVPTGIELVFYCPDDIGLSMSGGWRLWDMLMYGEYGGEQAAYAAKYKTFKAGSTVTDFYVCIDPGDYNQWDDGPHRAAGHSLVNSYGVWKVGDPTAPAIDFTLLPNYVTRLSNVVGQAIFEGKGVQRIYWGCCKVHTKAIGVTSKSARPSYTPQGLR